MPKLSNQKLEHLEKIYSEAEYIAYTKAIRSFSGEVGHNEPTLIDDQYSDGEIKAYVKATTIFEGDDLDLESSNIIKTYKDAEKEAFNKAIKSFNDPVYSDPLTDSPSYNKGVSDAIRDRQRYVESFSKGEADAYIKAIQMFDSPVFSETYHSRPTRYFFKNVPESLYCAKILQNKQNATKGMYIYQNWITVYLMTKRLYETGTELTWESFKNYATDLSVFIEEVTEDMPKGSTKVTELPDLLREIGDIWPPLKMIAGGARIAYDENDESQSTPLDKRYEAVIVPGRKMEVLGDVLSKTPDDYYIYDEKDQRAVEEIKMKFKEVFRNIIGMKEEIQKRSELYDSLLKLRQSLDTLQDLFDPKNLSKGSVFDEINLATVENIKLQLKNIYTNRYLDPQMASLVKKIDDKIDMDTWIFKANSNEGGVDILHKLRRGVNRVILRLNSDKIVEGLRAINAYYDQIWASIHKGRQLVSPSKV